MTDDLTHPCHCKAGEALSAALCERGLHLTRGGCCPAHSPTCTRPGTTTERGHSVDIVKCTGCGALSTTRHGAITTPRKD